MPDVSDNQELGISNTESKDVAPSLGEKQVSLASDWASVYSDSEKPLDPLAEIILRNPAVYLRGLDRHQLPEELKTRWQRLSAFANSLANVIENKQNSEDNINGLDKIQNLVFKNTINPNFRRTVADIMQVSSGLFSESIKISPLNQDDARYFEGNLTGAERWIKKHQNAPQST